MTKRFRSANIHEGMLRAPTRAFLHALGQDDDEIARPHIGVFHTGGEMKWWHLPATCSGAGDMASLESLTALALGAGPTIKVAMCDAVTWRFPNAEWGLSMSSWNAVVSACLAIFSLLAAKRHKDARAPRNGAEAMIKAAEHP